MNVDPLIDLYRSKFKTWSALPLSIAGRINLIKMVVLPKCLHVFQHSSVCVPNAFFHRLESLMDEFFGDRSRHKLRLSTCGHSWNILISITLNSYPFIDQPSRLGSIPKPLLSLMILQLTSRCGITQVYQNFFRSWTLRFVRIVGSPSQNIYMIITYLYLLTNLGQEMTCLACTSLDTSSCDMHALPNFLLPDCVSLSTLLLVY